jgi:PTS system nitrogen regulatory IIA component
MLKIPLSELFDEKLFLLDIKSRKKEDVLAELVDLFVKEKYIRNREILLEMLHQREMLGSTGIGKGVAIPHGRTIAVSKLVIAFGRSSRPINFNAIDNKPVSMFFMVIAPPNDEGNVYLPLLGSLVTLLNVSKNRDKLMKIQTYKEFLSVMSGEK